MYLEHYGLAEAPFRITPHTDFFFAGANRGATLEALIYAITHDEGIVKISGEVGSGKTMLCRVLMERLPQSVVVVYLANPSLSRDDILYALADELGIEVPEQSRAATVMRTLQEHLVGLYSEGKQVVVLIDEAHAMPMETLEEIRLLSNLESNRHKLLQLVLFGQPELDETLARDDMRQLRERITHNFKLEPLVREDIDRYLDFRMRAAGYHGPSVFAPPAIKLIAKASAGLTRRINILADKALLASFAAGIHQVGVREVRAAIKDSDFSPARGSGKRRPTWGSWVWAAGGAFATLTLIGLIKLLDPAATPPSPPPANVPASAPAPVPPSPEPAPQPSPPPAAAPAEAAPATTAPAIAPETTPPASEIAQTTPAVPARPLDRMLADSLPWIESVNADRWFIQLYATIDDSRPDLVERFVINARRSGLEPDLVRVYYSSFGEMSRYGVIYGDYASRKDAVKVLNTLPAELKRNRPYVRQAIRLRPPSNK
ncbi:MAG: AAA family ATPase [Rhodocyclaceae bacterium]|jgi:type II secretory pathway predicted ATPase ExeA/septal ring-binding cell division protein DamX|nr:AAA family ATPase [Rhodocyclaceae bacterium]